MRIREIGEEDFEEVLAMVDELAENKIDFHRHMDQDEFEVFLNIPVPRDSWPKTTR